MSSQLLTQIEAMMWVTRAQVATQKAKSISIETLGQGYELLGFTKHYDVITTMCQKILDRNKPSALTPGEFFNLMTLVHQNPDIEVCLIGHMEILEPFPAPNIEWFKGFRVGNIYRGHVERGKKFVPPESKNEQVIVYCHRPHLLGNPFKIGEDGTRADVIELYRNHLKLVFHSRTIGNVQSQGDKIKSKIFDLREKYLEGADIFLLCFCKLDERCHTDPLADFIRGHALT